MPNTVCNLDDCAGPVKYRGLCAYHYNHAKWHGTLEQVADSVRPTLAQTRGAEVLALWDNGASMYRIAQQTGITAPTVRAILVKHGVTDPARKSC